MVRQAGNVATSRVTITADDSPAVSGYYDEAGGWTITAGQRNHSDGIPG